MLLLGLAFGVLVGFRPKGSAAGSAHPESSSDGGDGGDSVPAPRPSAPESNKPSNRRWKRRLGRVFIVLGLVLLAYSATILLWRDPITDLYARWKQHQLAGQLADEFAAYAATVELTPPAGDDAGPATDQEVVEYEQVAVAAAAKELERTVKQGRPLGEIEIPRIDVRAVFVEGTRWGPDLTRGPGHYPQTSLPGVARTMGIAGHRTTFGAWFRHIDSLEPGDDVILRLPYATFEYRVFGHTIVDSDDWSIIRDRGFDTLVLSACHPLYSASHRWVVLAALVRVQPVDGLPYFINRRNEVSPATG